jgi:hypothetical protein
MSISEVDKILVKNFQESVKLYQQSLIWSATAASAFFVITLRIGKDEEIDTPWGKLGINYLWLIAMTLILLLGSFALSNLNNATSNLTKFSAHKELREAVLLYPSLATSPDCFFRIAGVVFSPLVTVIGMLIETRREGPWSEHPWGGFGIWLVILWTPYLMILEKVTRSPLNISSSKAVGAEAKRPRTPDP